MEQGLSGKSKMKCFFVSDLHGKQARLESLCERIRSDKPSILFIGGDITPSAFGYSGDYIHEVFVPEFRKLKNEMGKDYPAVYIILGNDDPRSFERELIEADKEGLMVYLHNRKEKIANHTVFGYSYIPPTPFLLKDWERYDVSRYVDPGCVHPTEGMRSVEVSKDEAMFSTIEKDLGLLTAQLQDLSKSIFLFHSPPYKSMLDRADLDGKTFDHVPLDVNVGSIAIERFIKTQQPLLTLHGHVHESSSITGEWKEQWGDTWMYSAAWNGKELALVIFDLNKLEMAERILI
ncbi:MAG: hypothetical protein C0594_06845 [Marinilabiliales bacterium]|nr:MAG: hypothetical protein C0594_06845 [Marinilabiliales bacterium]